MTPPDDPLDAPRKAGVAKREAVDRASTRQEAEQRADVRRAGSFAIFADSGWWWVVCVPFANLDPPRPARRCAFLRAGGRERL